jgi:4-hydroxybenzoate polyprenyltransferase
MAFAAVNGGNDFSHFSLATAWASVPPLAWLLLAGNLFWVLAYDTEYAMVDRDDDLRIGMKTSAITLGRWDVAAIMLFYAIYITIWTLALAKYAQSAMFYIAIGAAIVQVVWHGTLIRTRSRDGCFKAFRLNHWLGFAFFAGIAASYALRPA